jgi:hypothetical protein
VDKIVNLVNDDDIIPIFRDIPIWRYQRADLHAWVPVLDRFDDVLANVITSYELNKLQTNDFTPKTKELVLGILGATRMMLENCTSRKLYASYDVSEFTMNIAEPLSDWKIFFLRRIWTFCRPHFFSSYVLDSSTDLERPWGSRS